MKLGLKKHWPKMHLGTNLGEGQRSFKGQYWVVSVDQCGIDAITMIKVQQKSLILYV